MKNKSETIKYLISVLIYGTIGLFLHFINVSHEFVAFCRGTIGSVFIALVFLFTKKDVNFKTVKKNLKYLILSGASLGFNWMFLFAGYKHGIAVTSLCNYIAPILIIVLCAILFNEKPNYKQMLCVLVALVGIFFVSGIFEESNTTDIYCIIYGLLACLGFTGLILCNKKLVGLDPLEKTLFQLMISAITLIPYIILTKAYPTSIETTDIILLLILGLVHTGIAYILYFSSITVLPVQQVAILGYIEPVLSVLTGALIFNESMSIYTIIGAILIIGSCITNELFS